MLLKLFAILLGISAFLFVIYLFACKKDKRGSFTHLTGVLSALTLVVSIVLCILHIKVNDIKLFEKINKYDIVKTYSATLEKKGAQAAYPLLPNKLFSENNNIYFTNLKDDLFILNDQDGKFVPETVANNIKSIDGNKYINASLKTSGELIVDGFFLFSKYEQENLHFNKQTIAKDVTDFSITPNALLYITKSGNMYGLGFNAYGQLGDNSTKSKTSAALIKQNIIKADISDTHSMFIDKFGTLFAVGDNTYSQLGNKTAVSSVETLKIMQGIKDIKVGNYYSLVLSVNGDVYTAGINKSGQLGNGGGQSRAQLIPALSGVEKIDERNNTCAALSYDGKLYVWGNNKGNKVSPNEHDILTSPTLIAEDIYDFAITESGIAALTKNRVILVSDNAGNLIPALDLYANVPDEYKEKVKVPTDEMPVKA